jgi:hypothetical protein
MKLPGFTAEASLCKTDECRHNALIVQIDGMQVLPQFLGGCYFSCYPEYCLWIDPAGGLHQYVCGHQCRNRCWHL